ncbi:MAG: dTDP-4-dehydrorhamnose 3,5-epimerase family protein, partial [Candidatus Neomarinimicrobiota bacterium]|nr:dTDP-4-dehydrorhamnose 3,5-epimerase family protein [Candidatus Neomarinimicrobiota bacterium]
YLVLEDNTIVHYKCTNYYDPSSEYGIKWNDQEINIPWDISSPIISDKDKILPKLKDQKNLPQYQ